MAHQWAASATNGPYVVPWPHWWAMRGADLFTWGWQYARMKVLACYAVKGGVGKTSAAVDLAWLSAQDRHRTLLWDLDPQAAATFILRGKAKVKGGSRRLLQGKSEATRSIRTTADDMLDLLPAETSYLQGDLDLAATKRSEDRVAKVLASLVDDYDVVVLDCPAGLSLVSVNIVRASDVVLVPIVPSPLSLRTLDQVVELGARQGSHATVMAFLSMVDVRRALHRDLVERLQGRYADVASSVVPSSALVERMGQRRRPIVASAPASPAAAAYRALWTEVSARLGLPTPTADTSA
jgi:chromosome partitioning protein